jgi:hypothetical protein
MAYIRAHETSQKRNGKTENEPDQIVGCCAQQSPHRHQIGVVQST